MAAISHLMLDPVSERSADALSSTAEIFDVLPDD